MYTANSIGASVFYSWNLSNHEHSPYSSQVLLHPEPSNTRKKTSTGTMTSRVPARADIFGNYEVTTVLFAY